MNDNVNERFTRLRACTRGSLGVLRSSAGPVFLTACMGIFVVSCQTSKPSEIPPEPEPAPVVFRPATINSTIQARSGRYPNLFASESSAVWVSAEVAAMKRAAAVEAGESIDSELDATVQTVNESFYVFECHLASAFPDASIAYDVVGLRNIDVYLLTAKNDRILPIQRILGSHAGEEARGAIKLFRRTNIVVFPKRDILLDEPTLAAEAPGVRLVLEGFDSKFYFEWPAAPPEEALSPAQRKKPTPAERYQAVKVGFKDLFTRLSKLSHILD